MKKDRKPKEIRIDNKNKEMRTKKMKERWLNNEKWWDKRDHTKWLQEWWSVEIEHNEEIIERKTMIN
jgi:hypothetical protein